MAIELLAPAGSAEAMRAAIQNGADAVYIGLSDFNARRGAENFTVQTLGEAVKYCHVRGAKVHVALNTLVSDRELDHAAEMVRDIYLAGADAIIIQDLGLIRVVKETAPLLPIHASTQMSLHSLEGVRAAAALGADRAILARELGRRQLEFICRNAPIATEVFVHGALCMCYSGQCYMSALIGGRSGNRGLCAQPCRQSYGLGRSPDGDFPLSLKDLSLCGRLGELEKMGVASLKIEGRMRRPEYVGEATRIFRTLLDENRAPTADELSRLDTAYSRQGFTEGYFTERVSAEMLGVHEAKQGQLRLLRAAQNKAMRSELQRVKVTFECTVARGVPSLLTVHDRDGNRITIHGPVPEPAQRRAVLEAEICTQLYKTGSTPYFCEKAVCRVEPGLAFPLSAVNAMRREALDKLSELRGKAPDRQAGEYRKSVQYLNKTEPPELYVQVSSITQISGELLDMKPALIYIPLTEIEKDKKKVEDIIARAIPTALVLPRVIGDHEALKIAPMLDTARALGIEQALVGNLGHAVFARAKGLKVRGDFGLNIYNSGAVKVLKDLGYSSATLSFELNLPQIRDISKRIDCEMIVYGRLPLMVTESCIVKNTLGQCSCENNVSLVDKKSLYFPVMREFDHRNVIYNSKKLFLADKPEDYNRLGLSGVRLMFTTENPRECVQVIERYSGKGQYAPMDFTRGLYYRGVE